MSTHVKLVAVLTARPGKADDLLALLFGMRGPCRAEPGNLRWDIWSDSAQPGRFVLDELYADAEAIAAHRQTAHFLDYVAQINDLAERSVLTLDPVRVG